jgi:hypothetical protein
MAYDPSSPPCPRCGTPFPATSRFCRSCGLTQEVAQDPAWRSTTSAPVSDSQAQGNLYAGSQPYAPVAQSPAYGPAGQQPYAAPPDDPFARARNNPSYQAVPLGYADEPPPKRSFWRSFWGLSAIALLLLMVVGVSAFGIYFYPSLCSVQQRQSLPTDVPLPCGITYLNHLDRSASGTTGPGSQEWVYSVDGQNPAQIISFYQAKLTTSPYGWTLPSAIQSPENNALAACKGSLVALINGSQQERQEGDFTFDPPPGGSLLLIIEAPLKNLSPQIQQACALT